jgi:hypothetical protein
MSGRSVERGDGVESLEFKEWMGRGCHCANAEDFSSFERSQHLRHYLYHSIS